MATHLFKSTHQTQNQQTPSMTTLSPEVEAKILAKLDELTQAILQFRDFRKQATEQDFHLLNAQGEEIVGKPKVIVP